MKYEEKLLISLVTFVLVVVVTGGIVVSYVNVKKGVEEHKQNSIVLDSIHLF